MPMHPDSPVPAAGQFPRNPDLACYSDPMLLDVLLDTLLYGRTEDSVALAREVVARQLTSQVLVRARQRLQA